MVKAVVDPQKELSKALRKAAREVSDLREPLTLIAQSWFKSNRAIFTLKSKGKYVDLSPLYKKWKIRHLGTPYPILKLTGALEASITDPTDSFAVSQILNRTELFVGTKIPYAGVHHRGSRKRNIPIRPVVLFGNEQVAPGALAKRVDTWKKIIFDYCKRASGAS
jgi:phage gpG-like protein